MGRARTGLIALLLVSAGLRIWLAALGGQQYWPDEDRYIQSRNAVTHLFRGEWSDLSRELLSHADHLLFRWIGLPCALVEHFTGPQPMLAASYWGMFSVLTILLVWALARRLGAGEGEALLAASLAACANSLFYYSRHYFPYDAALALMLLAFWIGLSGRAWQIVLAGLLTGFGFLTYNGYWLFGGAVLFTLAALGPGRWLPAAMLASAGLVVSIALFVALGRLAGYDLITRWRDISGTVTQGDFGLGWRIIGEYIWSAEGPLGLIWLLAIMIGGWLWKRSGDRVLATWLLPVILTLTGLVLLSDVIQKFVVYGRLVRPLAPLLSLLAARVLVMGATQSLWSRCAITVVMMVVLATAAWNMAGPLQQEFPDHFRERARTLTRRLMREDYGVYRIVKVQHLWGVDIKTPLPPHQVMLRAAHPLQFQPYQFEGFSAVQRRDIATYDISMQLIRLNDVMNITGKNDDLGRYLGPVRIRLKLPPYFHGMAEPIITTGVPRRGDFLSVTYQDAAHIRFSHDHWGRGGVTSEAIPVDYNQEHELIVNMGPLLPPEWSPENPRRAWLDPLRSWLVVKLNGQTVLSTPASFFPAEPEDVSIGGNLIGGTSTAMGFSGSITLVERYPLGQMARFVPSSHLASYDRGADWSGAAGPWRIKIDLAKMKIGEREPLYCGATTQGLEAIVLQRVSAHTVRLGLERLGEPLHWSATFPVDVGKPHEVMFSCSSLYPEPEDAFFRKHAGLRVLKRLAFAAWDGRLVLLRNFEPLPGATQHTAVAATVDARLSMAPCFSGAVLALEPVEPTEVLRTSTQLAWQVPSRGDDWQGYPGPVRLRVRIPEILPERIVTEPLIVGGVTGAGDFFCIRYGEDGLVRFIFDHWGTPGLLESVPLKWKPGEEHEVVVSAGFLFPPTSSSLYNREPDWLAEHRRLAVAVGGKLVLDMLADFHLTTPEQITLGRNFIGGSTAAPAFSGTIAVVGLAPPPKPGN